MKQLYIPFQGFYESLHSVAIDDVVGDAVADDSGSVDIDDDAAQECMGAYHYTSKTLPAYAKEFAGIWLKEVTEATGFDLGAEFSHLWSPREYNFDTDTLYINVPNKAIVKMAQEVDKDLWAKKVKERLAPRSGFAPFYSNDVSHPDWDFALVTNWDTAQLSLLLEAWLQSCFVDTDELEQRVIEEMSCNGYTDTVVWDTAPDKWVKLANEFQENRRKKAG